MALDGDEFLTVKVGRGTVQDLTDHFAGNDEIRLNWMDFGSCGFTELSPDPVIERYTLTARPGLIATQPVGFKTLFRTRCFARPGIHKPRVPLTENIRTINGSGIPWDEIPAPSWRSIDPEKRKFAQVNHYPIRDLNSFLLKRDRGSASHLDRNVDLKYWAKFDHNDASDLTISRHIPAVRAEMEALNEQSRGRLFLLRQSAFDQWQKRLEVLLATDHVSKLRQQILAQR